LPAIRPEIISLMQNAMENARREREVLYPTGHRPAPAARDRRPPDRPVPRYADWHGDAADQCSFP